MAFTDELASGVVPAGAPELAAAFGLAPSRAAGWTLVAFQLLGLFLEPPLLALAQGRRARTMRLLGLWSMAAAMLAATLAPSYWILLAALMLYGPASGLGVGLSESALARARPNEVEAAFARWSLLGLIGDLIAPAALAVSVAFGLGWRGAMAAVGIMAAVQAVTAMRFPEPEREALAESDPAPLRAVMRAAVACPALLGWSLAAVLCGLMDEVLVSFGALWLEASFEAGATQRAVVLCAWTVGGILGAWLLERAAGRVRSSTMLAVSALGCAAAYLAWLSVRHWAASALTFGLAGLFAVTQYPLLRARAFAIMPGRPNVVLAVGSSFTAVELSIPFAVGMVADGAGLLAAMLVLLIQPLGALAAAFAARRSGG